MIQVIKNFFGKKQTRNLQNPEQWFLDAVGGIPLSSGVSVSESTAMRNTTVFACVRILADTISSLPLILYKKRNDGGKERAISHPLYPVLHDLPNPEITSFRLRSVLQAHLATWGNAYAYVIRDGNNRVRELWPIRPDIISVVREKSGLIYKINGERTQFEILHIPGLGFDGVKGYSVISLARESIGLGLAAEEFGARFFGEGTHPGAIVNHPAKLSDEAHNRLKASLAKAHSGLGKAHRLMLLEEGMKLENIGIPPEDAQFIETRKYQRSEIYALFRIPPHMLGDAEKSTSWGSGIEQQSIGFVVYTIRPWLVLWEQELSRVLLSEADRKAGYFIEHLVDGLLRGDIKSRYEAYSVGRQNGWLSANDIRGLENMNPIEDGDQYIVPLNMAPVGQTSSENVEPGTEEKKQASHTEHRKLTEDEKTIKGLTELESEYLSKFRSVFEEIIKTETTDLEDEIKKQYQVRNDDSFLSWVDEYYAAFPDNLKKNLAPLLREYAFFVENQAAKIIGKDPDFNKNLERFVDNYLDVYVTRHIGSSVGQLKSLVMATDAEFLSDKLLNRLSEWESRRPDKIASDEVIRAANAIARESWRQKGIKKLKWVTQGSKNCPFCKQLHGKIVGIKEVFLNKNDVLTGEDGSGNFMRIKGMKSHPPIHQTCVCGIVPV